MDAAVLQILKRHKLITVRDRDDDLPDPRVATDRSVRTP